MNFDDMCIDKLKSAKLKATPQRIAILKLLLNTKSHPNIEQIFKKVKRKYPTISIATVYNTMEVLKEKGAVIVLNFDEGFTRYDGALNSHGHFFCLKCKKIFDIMDDMEKILNLKKIKILKKFKVDNTSLSFNGLCDKCK